MKEFIQNPEVIPYDIGEEGIMLYYGMTRETHVLNTVGRYIWMASEKQTSLDSLLQKMHEEFIGIDQKEKEEIFDFVDSLIEKNILLLV